MEITIGKTTENPYLQRKEVHGEMSFTGATPSQKQLADALAAKLGAKADAIFVLHVYNEFGSQKARFEAHIYPSREQLEKVVRVGKKAKEKAAGKPASGTAPAAEAKPAAAPKAEEKKEAPKKEAKPAEARKEEPKKEAKPAEKPAEARKEPKKEEPKKAEVKA
jgi:ribosomal protein S24E